MKEAGYGELYRKRTLEQALRFYDRLAADEKDLFIDLKTDVQWKEDRQNKGGCFID